jgi:16S rRNA (guanine527-N7)-methyltransferase
METSRIAELLGPFVPVPPSKIELDCISTYIDLLLLWNRKLNLTAVRDPEQIVTRHFGESLFAAQRLFANMPLNAGMQLCDLGSGAGFPGIPIKFAFPELHVTLIESTQKKSVFLREVIRNLALTNIDVFAGRAETAAAGSADVVTLRAVERFEEALPVAARLVRPQGRVALLIGQAQVARATTVLSRFSWQTEVPIPMSSSRVLFVGTAPAQEPF